MATATARAILAIANSFPCRENGDPTQGLLAGFGRLFRSVAGEDGKASVRDAAGGVGGVIVVDGAGAAPSGCCWGGGAEPELGVPVDG
jgi:hypothetical protein